MKGDVRQELRAAAEKIAKGELQAFQGTEEFYGYLKTQGTTLSLAEVQAALLDMNKPKTELGMEDLEAVAGGGQVEVYIDVNDNSGNVKVGSTVVIVM